MRTFIVCSLAICVSACSVENRGAPADTVAAKTPPPAAADSGRPSTPPASTGAWTVTPSGIGEVTVGMSVEDLRREAGDVTLPAGGATECIYVRPSKASPGVSVMLASGRVARVDVDSAGVQSDGGVAVGDSASKVEAAYAGRVSTLPHKYVAGGQYLTVRAASPADTTLRIVFESEGGRITRFRSGRVPEVQFVERCG